MSSTQKIRHVTLLPGAAAPERRPQDGHDSEDCDESKAPDSTPTPPLGAIPEKGTPPPSNDNARRGGAPDTTPLVARADVVRYLRATLQRYGVAPQDLADAIAEVQLGSIEAARTGRMPSGPAQWKALAATIAARSAIDHLRDTAVREKYDAGLCDDADAFACAILHREERDPVDTKRALAVLKELFDSGQMPGRAAEILWGEADQTPHAEIAAEVGVTETAVDNRLSRMRTTFRARLAALGLLPLLLLLSILLRTPSGGERVPAVRTRSPEPEPSVRCVPRWDAGTPIVEKSSSPVRGNGALHD